MRLGAVSHFNQAWPVQILPAAEGIGVDLLRDGVRWSEIEARAGEFRFEGSASLYPDVLAATQADQIMVFGRPSAHVDGGHTPYTDAGRAAFAEFVAAVLDRFPSVGTIEIGNEFNGRNFVSGPVRDAGYAERNEYYAELLEAVHDRISDEFPQVVILGGATHSVPVGYLRDTFELGALDHSDGIAVHPYTSAPEHLGTHLELLKGAMGAEPQPIYVTEFGQAFDAPEDAPAYMAKMVAVMSAAGVEAATWYALREQHWFPNMELLGFDGSPTPAGEAFVVMQDLLDRGDARDVSPDDLTHAYRFGRDAMMLWGAPREVELASGAVAYSAAGERLDGAVRLGMDEPLIVLSDRPIELGEGVRLGESAVVGDSFLQFDVTNEADGSETFEGPWSWYERRAGDGRMRELVTAEGGERPGDIWKPYLDGGDYRRPLMVNETGVRPVDFSDGKVANARFDVVERFTAAETMTVEVEGWWEVGGDSQDGVDLIVRHEGEELWSGVVTDRLDLGLDGIALAKGDVLDFVVGVNGTSKGDLTERQITIVRDGETLAAEAPASTGPTLPPTPTPTTMTDECVTEGRVVAEIGSAVVGGDGIAVTLEHDFENPVVIASITTGDAGEPMTARVLDVKSDGFTLLLDEPDHLAGLPGPETVSYVVVEAGRWTLWDGTVIEAGLTSAGGHRGMATAAGEFAAAFEAAPALLSTVQSMKGSEFIWTRTAEIGRDGFEITMTEEEASMRSRHAHETIGWLAVEGGVGQARSDGGGWIAFDAAADGVTGGSRWAELDLDPSLDGAPHVFASVGTAEQDPVGVVVDADRSRVRLQEDWSRDAETAHVDEAVQWLAIGGDGLILEL